jgi:chorismate lyase/3-hydroxybenzoate synthase
MDAITEGHGDDERYRRFCVGRARGIGRDLVPGELPAATAIGHPRHGGRFQLYWLAARNAGTPLENPRQTQAWRYPRQYGPAGTGFARAMLPAMRRCRGCCRHHGGGRACLAARRFAGRSWMKPRPALAWSPPRALQRPTAATRARARLKVYVRDAEAMPQVAALLDQRLAGRCAAHRPAGPGLPPRTGGRDRRRACLMP